MKYAVVFLIVCFAWSSAFAHGHENAAKDRASLDMHSAAIDIGFHSIVFGGLGIAAVIGMRENKKTTGKRFVWYRG